MKQSMSRRRFGAVVGVGVAGLAVPRGAGAQTLPRTPIIIKSGSLRILSGVQFTQSTDAAEGGPADTFVYTASLGGPVRIDYFDFDDDLDVQPDDQAAGARTATFTLPRTFGADQQATLAISATGGVTLTVPQRLRTLGSGSGRFRYRLDKDASEVTIRVDGGSERRGRFKNALIAVRQE